MEHQGGSFRQNDKGEMGAVVEVVTAWERTKKGIDPASSPRGKPQQVGRVSEEDDSNGESPPHSVINELAHPYGGRVKRFLTPPDKVTADMNHQVNYSSCGAINRGEDDTREEEGMDGSVPSLHRSYGSEDAPWKSTRESSDDVGGVHHEGDAASSDEGEMSLRGEVFPSNDSFLREEDPIRESLDEREKRNVYRKADEIINQDSGGGEDWLLSEAEVNEQPRGETKQQSGVRKHNLLDRHAFNLSAGELHSFLKRDKYHLTKMKTRMRNVVYRYLYERARGKNHPGEKESMNGEASSMPPTDTLEAETDVATSDIANLLHTECTIRKTRIAQLRNVSKLVCDRRNDKCMQILRYKNVYLFGGSGCSPQGEPTTPPRQGEVTPQRLTPSGRHPTCRFTCNNHFVCLQRKDDEVHVFSHRVLSLNEFIFFKDKESKTTNQEEISKYLDDLTCSGFERSCKRIKLDWGAYPFYIIKDSSWKEIKSIHLNESNHLCIYTDAGTFVYELLFMNGTIRVKFSGSYFHRSGSSLNQVDVLEAYLHSEKRMIHVGSCNLFLLQRNSKLFKGDLFTIVKEIKFRKRILSVSFSGDWIILSFSNRVSVHHKASGKVHFVVQVNSQGDVLGGEVTKEATQNGVPKDVQKGDQKGDQVDSSHVGDATTVGISEPTHCIPFLCPLEGDNLFCLAYGRKITIVEYSTEIVVLKQFAMKHSVKLLRSVRNNVLVIYGEKELYVYQLVCVKKEFSLVFFFNKTVKDAKCWKVHDEGRTFEFYGDAIKVKVKLIKINRDDEVARRIFYALNGGPTKGDTTHGGIPPGDSPIGTVGEVAHFYVNLLYIYILDGGKIDLVVVNSLVYLIYLLFSHHRYGLLLALLLHLYKGNCCVLTDFPVDEEDRRDKLKPLFHFLFETRMNDIVKNGNRFGIDPRNSIYHVSDHTSNSVSQNFHSMGSSSESTASPSVDQPICESISVSLNDNVSTDEEEKATEGSIPSPGAVTPHGGGGIRIGGRAISDKCIEELQKLCLLGIEISIRYNMNLYECMFQLLRGFGAETVYFHLIEEYILRKRIGITHPSLVDTLTEHFKRLYRMFSEYDDSCYDVFLFFCSFVRGALGGDHLNEQRLNEKHLNEQHLIEQRLIEVVFSPFQKDDDCSDEPGGMLCGDGCADLDAHLYLHHLGGKNIWRKIKRVYSFICIVELFFRLFEGIILEGDIEGVISHFPIHLSAFLYNKHIEDRTTTAEFFISYLIRKKNNLFYSFCRCNSLRSDELPIYLPMYLYRNFFHSYFLFDFVFSVFFKVPFSVGLDRFAVPLEGGISLRGCQGKVDEEVGANFQFEDCLNYKNVFFLFSPFRVERENHCTLNRTILSLWRYLLDGTDGQMGRGLSSGVCSVVSVANIRNVDRGDDGGGFLAFLSPNWGRSSDDATCSERNDKQKIHLNDYFNLDKNGIFLLLQLSLKDTFYLLNRSLFQYDFTDHYDVVNLLVRNLCLFYLHMVITFIVYLTYLRNILRHSLSEETCVQIYREILLTVNSCKKYDEVCDLCVRLTHVIESERHTHLQKNLPTIVRWIALQLFYLNRHRKETANSVTYFLILFFILQGDSGDSYFFDYLLGVYFVNFLLRLSCGGGEKNRMNQTRGRRRFGKLTKRCFHFAKQNYLHKVRPYLKERSFLRTFRLKETNLRINRRDVRKNVEETSSPESNLVNYLLGAVYNVDVTDLLRHHGDVAGGSGGDDPGGCAFKRVPTRAGKTKKEQKQEDIFCVQFCRRHYGYILLLYVKRLLVLHEGGLSSRGKNREKVNPEQSSKDTTQQRRRRRKVEKLLKYILFFSHVRKCEPVYLVILNHFGRYDVLLDHYRARQQWKSMYAYIFGNIFFFSKERKVKRRLRGYLFYGDVLQHVDVMSDIFVNYLLGNYVLFHNRTVRLLRGGATPKGSDKTVMHTNVRKGDETNQSPWGKEHLMSLCKLFTRTLIRCQNFSDLMKQRVYYLLLHEARMPSRIQRYLHRKIFYAYLTLLCKYKKGHVYRCVRYVNVEKYKELFELHGNVNVLLHLYEKQGKFLNIVDLCLKLIRENILKLKNAFCREEDWFVPKDVTYGDMYSVRFCSRIDIYNLSAMPLKRSVRRLLPRGDSKGDRAHHAGHDDEEQDVLVGSVTQRDSFLGKLLSQVNSAEERIAWESYFVKTPLWGGKPKRNRPKGDTNGMTTIGDAKKAHLLKACRIFLTREYNVVFLYIYMLTSILRRNKLQNDRINEYVFFFIVNECVRGFISVCEHLVGGAQGQHDERDLLREKGHSTTSPQCQPSEKKDKEVHIHPDGVAFFSYLFDQVVFFVINISSHRHVQRICKQLLVKYRMFQVKLVRPPLIGLLKSMTETYSLLSNSCHVLERRIKRQIETYTFERKKGLVVDFHVDHTHPFNIKLCARNKRGGEPARQYRNDQINQSSQPIQPNQLIQQEQEELLPENCKDCTPLGDALWLSKCEHSHHFSCSQRCHLCGASAEQSRKSVP